MPIAPVVGKDFKSTNGLRVSIVQTGPVDVNGASFLGVVRQGGGNFTYSLYTALGVNLDNTAWNLESEWPAVDPIRYQAVMPTQDGTWKVVATVYVNLADLRKDWWDKGCRWYATVSRNGGGNPTLSVSALT